MKKIRIGLIGWGTVGTGVLKILRKNGGLISERLGAELEVARIADTDLSRPRKIRVRRSLLTADAAEVVADPSIDVVVELIGGLEPAGSYILGALKAGKYVVTANKAVLARRGRSIFRAAASSSREVFFEASVGGAIPVVKGLREGLAANRITSILGIVNGTTNYILSRMTDEGLSMDAALDEARVLGYAEPDPSLDLAGLDSAHKLVILASLAFGAWLDYRKVLVEGIGGVTSEDILYTGELGYTVKLLAIAKDGPAGIEMRVHPTLIPRHHLLASVSGVLNAVYLDGDFSGQSMFYGQGAGEGPAASAVVADLIEAGRMILGKAVPSAGVPLGRRLPRLLPVGDIECSHYLRLQAVDRPGVLARIASILAARGIGIASVIQRGRREKGAVPVIIMTHRALEARMNSALKEIKALSVIKEPPVRIRVER
ncbi:MAG TPA: homoserine dehydrogenase [bacterium]|nr:homoserine dehydrogenase [bacterium]HPQ65538.1 homoserine dehydrogenase [bacterium]